MKEYSHRVLFLFCMLYLISCGASTNNISTTTYDKSQMSSEDIYCLKGSGFVSKEVYRKLLSQKALGKYRGLGEAEYSQSLKATKDRADRYALVDIAKGIKITVKNENYFQFSEQGNNNTSDHIEIFQQNTATYTAMIFQNLKTIRWFDDVEGIVYTIVEIEKTDLHRSISIHDEKVQSLSLGYFEKGMREEKYRNYSKAIQYYSMSYYIATQGINVTAKYFDRAKMKKMILMVEAKDRGGGLFSKVHIKSFPPTKLLGDNYRCKLNFNIMGEPVKQLPVSILNSKTVRMVSDETGNVVFNISKNNNNGTTEISVSFDMDYITRQANFELYGTVDKSLNKEIYLKSKRVKIIYEPRNVYVSFISKDFALSSESFQSSMSFSVNLIFQEIPVSPSQYKNIIYKQTIDEYPFKNYEFVILGELNANIYRNDVSGLFIVEGSLEGIMFSPRAVRIISPVKTKKISMLDINRTNAIQLFKSSLIKEIETIVVSNL